MKKLVIIGGGPAGMMAAISAKTHHPTFDVSLIEKNEELGKKLKITGGGRCNVTAAVSNQEVVQAVVKNGKFLYSALSHFNTDDIQSFFVENGCALKIEDHDRVFPKSNKAIDIIQTLQNKLQALNVNLYFNTDVIDVNPQAKQLVLANALPAMSYDYLIITTGGKTYHQTGSDGSGYALAEKFGHTITELLPAEVPLVSNDAVIANKTLQGLSFQDITLTVLNAKKKKFKQITHDLLFTHFGISGPATLRASFFVQKILLQEKTCQLTIDFLPTFSQDELFHLLKNDRDTFAAETKLPKRFVTYIFTQAHHRAEHIVNYCKHFPLTIYDTRGFSQAFVTNGGVSLKEVSPHTLKSKLDKSLAFAGEVLDINAYTGGYNITAALSTGYTAGKYISES